jgi:pilus assembly protein CpaF
MLQAMNTGHDGSLTTVHANSPRDAISRLETLVLMAGMDLPISVVRRQIVSALEVIIQQSRLRDGSRKVTSITEVQGLEGDTPVLQEVFAFEEFGEENGKVQGRLKPTGIRPGFTEKLITYGFNLPPSMFIGAGQGGGGRQRR